MTKDTALVLFVTIDMTLAVAATGWAVWWLVNRVVRRELALTDAQRAVRGARRASDAMKRGGRRD